MENLSAGNGTSSNDAKVQKNVTEMQQSGHGWTNQASAQDLKMHSEKMSLSQNQSNVTQGSYESNEDSDQEFGDYINDDADNYYDEEETIDEEEAACAEGDPDELNALAKESEMPLDELIALYWAKKDSDGVEYNSNEEIQKTFENSQKVSNESDDNEDLTRQLRSSTSFLSPNHHQSGDEEDHDYIPPLLDEWKKAPRVGQEYQVDYIPNREQQNPDYDVAEDLLMWNPSTLSEDKTKSYLKTVGEPPHLPGTLTLPSGSHLRDNEEALLLLTQCNSNTDEAIKKFRQRPTNLVKDMTVWTEEECRQFEDGLTIYGKDFHAIHINNVKNKSIGEIVKFYYIWKKTERYDHFNAKTRLGKKKDTMHPGVTDYMERLLDETERSMASQHGQPANSPFPPVLSHSAALQQHIAEARLIRKQNRQHINNESESSSVDYSEMNGFVEADYSDEIDMLDGIIPTLPANHIYPPVPFAPIDAALNVAYGDAGPFTPMAASNHHDLLSVGGLPANQNNNSHVLPSLSATSDDVDANRLSLPAGSGLLHESNSTELLRSVDDLAGTWYNPTDNGTDDRHSTSVNYSGDVSAQIDSPSEHATNALNLKRFHCTIPLAEDQVKKKRNEDTDVHCSPSANSSPSLGSSHDRTSSMDAPHPHRSNQPISPKELISEETKKEASLPLGGC